MDVERIAAIREHATTGHGSRHWAMSSAAHWELVVELLDHIDALQAENELLRMDRAAAFHILNQRDALQARVTLLEGLLGRVRGSIQTRVHVGSSAFATFDAELLGEIDAALSRSDAEPASGTNSTEVRAMHCVATCVALPVS